MACTVTSSGAWFLVKDAPAAGTKEHIAAHGSVTLPENVSSDSFTVQKQVFNGSQVLEAVVTWGNPAQPAARLRVMGHKAAAAAFDWCKVGLTEPYMSRRSYCCHVILRRHAFDERMQLWSCLTQITLHVSQGVDHGYVLEYQVRKEAANQAEIVVDMATAGEWFGGGGCSAPTCRELKTTPFIDKPASPGAATH